jgi:hypothetical protein
MPLGVMSKWRDRPLPDFYDTASRRTAAFALPPFTQGAAFFNLIDSVRTATAKAPACDAPFSQLLSIKFRSMHKGVHLPWLKTQQAHRAKGALWACD